MWIPSDAIHVNLGAGTASLHVAGQHVRDFFNIPNSLNNGHSVSATVSYSIRWHGVKNRRHVHNEDFHVAGLFLDTHATIDWTGHNANGFHFASDDEGQTTISAQIGHERNGVFFR